MRSAHEPGYLLVVDDNKVNRILLARGLEGDGHKVETAENGKQALEKLRDRCFRSRLAGYRDARDEWLSGTRNLFAGL